MADDTPKHHSAGWFNCAAQWVSKQAGRAPVFAMAVGCVVIWAATGPIFGFSETWQLVINTGTTIITFLMVFLIQNTQNRDTQAIQLKLDELIWANSEARNKMLGLDELSDHELEELKHEFDRLAKEKVEEAREDDKREQDATLEKVKD